VKKASLEFIQRGFFYEQGSSVDRLFLKNPKSFIGGS
tara:strand:+ start:811 stop:921 length:111 start_codon:yes stop_codon:yes gene_type:complete